MQKVWQIENKFGVWSIIPRNGRYQATWNDENLGSYFAPGQAAEDLANGHVFFPSSGIDPSTCGLPEDIGEWPVVRRTT